MGAERECCFELQDVVKQRGPHFTLSISCHRFGTGVIHAVVGPNGSGKTTLLALLDLLEAPDGGEIRYGGASVRSTTEAVALRRRMAYVMQDPYLFRGTVLDNLTYGLKLRGLSRADARQRATRCLERMGLKGFEKRRASRLSGGEVKRVAIARALVIEPDILLLDEPTANVDRSRVHLIEDEIRRVNTEQATTVILTTHDLDQARRLTSSIVSLVAGRITSVPPDNVFHCEIARDDEGARAHLAGGPTIRLAAEVDGPTHIAIHPSDIIVSPHPLDSSALNCFPGRVTRLTSDDGGVRVDVNAGTVFHVLITQASCNRMSIAPGTEVFLTFKASSVHVL